MSISHLFPVCPTPFFLLACSPRPGGNSDTAARIFADAYSRIRPLPVDIKEGTGNAAAPVMETTYLRSHRVDPCIACGACSQTAETLRPNVTIQQKREHAALPFGCPLTIKDDSTSLLHSLCTAAHICIVTPIYFYHLPAHFKGLIDRMQTFWALYEAGNYRFMGGKKRTCHTILLAARKQGAKLFEGSLLTIKCALDSLDVHMMEPLTLYGLDRPHDLVNQPETVQMVKEYAENAARLDGQVHDG